MDVQESQFDLPPEKADISFLILFELHLGQETSDRVSVDLKRNSNSFLHLPHLNSYIGIFRVTSFSVIYGMDGQMSRSGESGMHAVGSKQIDIWILFK